MKFKYTASIYSSANETKYRVKSVYQFEVDEDEVEAVVIHLNNTFKDDPFCKIGAFVRGWHETLP